MYKCKVLLEVLSGFRSQPSVWKLLDVQQCGQPAACSGRGGGTVCWGSPLSRGSTERARSGRGASAVLPAPGTRLWRELRAGSVGHGASAVLGNSLQNLKVCRCFRTRVLLNYSEIATRDETGVQSSPSENLPARSCLLQSGPHSPSLYPFHTCL